MDASAHVRATCLALPEVTERLSHGHPAFFVRRPQFLALSDDHHGDDRVAFVCAAPPGAQAAYVARDPERWFVPKYVGHRGWLGVRLDRGLPREEIEGAIEDAYAAVAPASLLEQALALRGLG